MYRQLSLDLFNCEENLKCDDLLATFPVVIQILLKNNFKQIHGYLFDIDI